MNIFFINLQLLQKVRSYLNLGRAVFSFFRGHFSGNLNILENSLDAESKRKSPMSIQNRSNKIYTLKFIHFIHKEDIYVHIIYIF